MAEALRSQDRNEWAWVIRTFLFDRFIAERVAGGADMVVNLAAGLDARPYRMALPSSLLWVEVDLPEILREKQLVLASERPSCALERVALDLSDGSGRRELFRRLGARAESAVIVTEGLLIYLSESGVASLAEDLAAQRTFRHWILDIASPALLRMISRQVGPALERARAPLRFAPNTGPNFFAPHGWRSVGAHSTLRTAARERRVGPLLRLLARLPEKPEAHGSRIWSGTCLLENSFHSEAAPAPST
jgi:methyltransferase (TIGR00027 family)